MPYPATWALSASKSSPRLRSLSRLRRESRRGVVTSAGNVRAGTENPSAAWIAVDQPRMMGLAQDSGILPRPGKIAIVPDVFGNRDRCRQFARPLSQCPHETAHARPVVGRLGRRALLIQRHVRHAGQHLIAAGRMRVVAGHDGPQHGDLLRPLGDLRHQLADVQARRLGGDDAESTANLRGASGLGSHVSCCGGPPTRPNTMTDFARPKDPELGKFADRACDDKSCDSVKPPSDSPPTCSHLRRETPSHSLRPSESTKFSMVGNWLGGITRSQC